MNHQALQGGSRRLALPLLLLVYLINPTDCSYQIGEYIQAAQRDQFKQVCTIGISGAQSHAAVQLTRTPVQTRTHWHDLLGHYCPRFGRDRLVSNHTMSGCTCVHVKLPCMLHHSSPTIICRFFLFAGCASTAQT